VYGFEIPQGLCGMSIYRRSALGRPRITASFFARSIGAAKGHQPGTISGEADLSRPTEAALAVSAANNAV